MNLKFSGKYKSITDFEWNNIPDFAIITGANGSGKTQFLELLYLSLVLPSTIQNKIEISEFSISPLDIEYIKDNHWHLAESPEMGLHYLQEKHTRLKQGLNNNGNLDTEYLKNTLQHSPTSQIREYLLRNAISKNIGPNFNNITLDKIEEVLPDSYILNHSNLFTNISEVFVQYQFDYYDTLIASKRQNTNEEIKEKIGPEPWVVLRDIINQSGLPFEINDPTNMQIRDKFKLQIKHSITGDNINTHNLSSGEKVIFSLLIYLFNSEKRNIFPRLLLLDEPDAHLHPTMAQQFINVIKNVLVDKYKVKVILTTHSPSTVVLAPEESLFVMSQNSPRIKKTDSKNESVSLLTSGLVYVGIGTKYVLVEDEADQIFYTYIHDKLHQDKLINTSIPVVFIAISNKEADKAGGKNQVKSWFNKFAGIDGLENTFVGLIDKDCNNKENKGLFVINMYCHENYLANPIILYAALNEKKLSPNLGFHILEGEEYKLLSQPQEILQIIINFFAEKFKVDATKEFNLSEKDFEQISIQFTNKQQLALPRWMIEKNGKTIINKIYLPKYRNINSNVLLNSFKRLSFIPIELLNVYLRLQQYPN